MAELGDVGLLILVTEAKDGKLEVQGLTGQLKRDLLSKLKKSKRPRELGAVVHAFIPAENDSVNPDSYGNTVSSIK